MKMENIKDLSKTQLVEKISVMEDEINRLNLVLEQQDSILNDWSGNLGKWEWNVQENKVQFDKKRVETLG